MLSESFDYFLPSDLNAAFYFRYISCGNFKEVHLLFTVCFKEK